MSRSHIRVTACASVSVGVQVAGFRRRVDFQRDNVLEVQLQGDPGSRLTLCAAGTDGIPPVIAIAAPRTSLITRERSIDATP